ncbi:hypothetical protein GCM10009069_05550 [Algimonas arctica]|uniref:Uncharacterized protein n=1 Tax=Algimonas arctica TaxID=1479486 RepID=A0A8J3CNY7_9PROT|nr:hypothetical protein GCM10009069_05550 [Algimonas arctica]
MQICRLGISLYNEQFVGGRGVGAPLTYQLSKAHDLITNPALIVTKWLAGSGTRKRL